MLTLLFYARNSRMASHAGSPQEGLEVGDKATMQRDGGLHPLHCQDGMVVMVVINVVALLTDGAEMAVVSLGHWAHHIRVNIGLCRRLLDNSSRRPQTMWTYHYLLLGV